MTGRRVSAELIGSLLVCGGKKHDVAADVGRGLATLTRRGSAAFRGVNVKHLETQRTL